MASPSSNPSNLAGPTALKVGSYTFVSDSSPDELGLGAVEQKLVVTDMPGGSRVTMSMGAHPLDVEWSSTFWGPNVAGGITALRAYCVTGQEYSISWGTEAYYCKIRSITPSYQHANRAGYRFALVITRDANGALSISKAISVDAQLQALNQAAVAQYNAIAGQYTTVLGVTPPAVVTALNSSLYNVGSLLKSAGPIAQASPSAIQSLGSALNIAINQAQRYLGTLAPFDPNLVPATRLFSALQLMGANVARGQAAQTVSVQGGSLYEIAAQYYGDPTLAFSLMAANGLASPTLPNTRTTTLQLPPFQKAS